MTNFLAIVTVGLVLVLSDVGACHAQSKNDDDVATLYRESVAMSGARLHIATFDADEKMAGGNRFDYNWSNCITAASLFEAQSGTVVRYWCEKGFYRK